MNSTDAFSRAEELMASMQVTDPTKRVQTLGDIEIETKIDMRTLEDIRLMFERILSLSEGIRKKKIRVQHHTVFASSPLAYHGAVLQPGSPNVHVRSKSAGELIVTPQGTPIFARMENKIDPSLGDEYYTRMREVLSLPKIGSFDKQCLDVSFWRKGLSYSGTVSLVQNASTRAESHQYELEYDGHRKGDPIPPAERIITELDEVSRQLFEGFEMSRLTKLRWLVGDDGPKDVVPDYEEITPSQSELLRPFGEGKL